VIAPAAAGSRGGFSPKDLTWILTHAPAETLVLRPDPDGVAEEGDDASTGEAETET
jgi:hypothetical protein